MTSRFATIVSACIWNENWRHILRDVPVLLMATRELTIQPDLTTEDYGDPKENWRN